MVPKLTKNSAAVKLLLFKFRSGKITASHTPPDIWKSENIFQQYKLPTFPTRFHEVKKQVQEEHNEQEKEPHDELNRKCTVAFDRAERPRLMDDEVEESEDGEDSLARYVTAAEFETIHSFIPLHFFSHWEEEYTRTRRLTVAILLPSGVGSDDFSLHVLDPGTAIELTVRWPQALYDMEMLHRKWLASDNPTERIESYHSKIAGFEKSLMDYRHLATDCIESVARIALPFPVETDIANKSNIVSKDSIARVVYLDLKGAVENYSVAKDGDEFVLH